MPIFTAIATALLAGTALAGTFAVTALATGLSLAASIGLSYAAKALAGNPNGETPQAPQGVQGTLQAGADTPRSFNIGYSATAGSLVYANTWGTITPGGGTQPTPNAYLTQVIALADLPGGTLQEVWVNGELVTLTATGASADLGQAVVEYSKDGQPYLWVKYYDGTQTTADSFLAGTVSSTERPYETTRVGTGVAHVIVTSLVNEKLFTGFPTFKFAVSGIPLYDPTKDSTNGGSGSHRWSDPSTWGGDGDQLPAVQAYNILRGIYYNGAWLYGLQRMTAARLPSANWNAQIAKCRATITGTSGLEPTYRTGGQVSVSVQTVQTIEALLTGCQGRISEIGGFYKIHLGAPDSSGVASFTDDDILSTEEQNFAPFFGLADSVNGITATYPSPAEGWNSKVAPPLFSSVFEAEDGSRRLLANPAFDFVPYDAQVQRLQKSALQEARRARRHSFVLPPAFWVVEPGDIIEWTSARNGYISKLFRVDGITDKANLDVVFNVTEVDPADYDWTHSSDFQNVTTGATVLPRPAPQGVVDWFVEPYTLLSAGQPRRPAIRLSWDGNMPGVDGVQYEVRLVEDGTVVTRGRTDQLAVGSIIVSQSLIPDTDYEARGQYLPSWPRDMLWSDWLPVTTPAVSVTIDDFDGALHYNVVTLQDAFNDRLLEVEQKFATLTSLIGAQQWADTQSVRSQLSSRSDAAFAEITRVDTVQTSATAALATSVDTISATIGGSFSTVNTISTAFATLNSAYSSFANTATATWGSVSAFVTQSASAISTLNGYAAAQYSVTLDVNGYASGFNLVNGGPGFSTFTIKADKFQIQLPGYNGSAPVPVFTTGTLSGSAAIGISANVFLDGTLTARAIAAGTITAVQIAANTITAAKIATGTITSASGAIGALSVNSFSIGDNAVTVPVADTQTGVAGGPAINVTLNSVTLSVDTTGLAGKSITIVAGWTGSLSYTGSGGSPTATLYIGGAAIQTVGANNSTDWFLSLTGSGTFTASGGVDSVTVEVKWSTNTTGNPTMQSRTLWAVAAKR